VLAIRTHDLWIQRPTTHYYTGLCTIYKAPQTSLCRNHNTRTECSRINNLQRLTGEKSEVLGVRSPLIFKCLRLYCVLCLRNRYFAITRPFQYAMKRTPGRMALMITAAWALSALISIPPLFGWKANPRPGECAVSQAIGYQFYATFGAFYLPLLVMVVIYYRIYMVSSRLADAEARSKPLKVIRADSERQNSHQHLRPTSSTLSAGKQQPATESGQPLESTAPVTPVSRSAVSDIVGRSIDGVQQPASSDVASNACNGSDHMTTASRVFNVGCMASLRRYHRDRSPISTPCAKAAGGEVDLGGLAAGVREAVAVAARSRSSTATLSVKECKATRTLGVIMGAFTACWLPFFVLALVKPFCSEQSDCIPSWLSSLFLWLGYANSFLNPIIYARFNREFRTPFKEILLFRCRGINSRLRTETYAEQFGLILQPGGAGGPRLAHRRPPAGTSVVAMAAAAAVHTVVQYQDALRRTSVRLKDHRLGISGIAEEEIGNNGSSNVNNKPTDL